MINYKDKSVTTDILR